MVARVRNIFQGSTFWQAVFQHRGSEDLADEHYPKEPIIGAPPNIGHDTDSFSSDWAYFVDRWSRALYTSLSGKLMRDDVAISAGHKHDTPFDDLHWQEFGRVRPTGNNQGIGGPDEAEDYAYCATSSGGSGMNMLCHIPTQHNAADLFVRIASPLPGSADGDRFYLLIDVYDMLTDVVTPAYSRIMSITSVTGSLLFPNKWLGPSTIKVKDFASIRGMYWIRIRCRGQLDFPREAGIAEMRLGKVRT